MEKADRLTLQQLRYFIAVTDTKHFTRAAELAGVAQPSLSKQVLRLEAELGTPLFSRVRGNVTLTPAGEALLPIARRILADVDTARHEAAALVGLRRGPPGGGGAARPPATSSRTSTQHGTRSPNSSACAGAACASARHRACAPAFS